MGEKQANVKQELQKRADGHHPENCLSFDIERDLPPFP